MEYKNRSTSLLWRFTMYIYYTYVIHVLYDTIFVQTLTADHNAISTFTAFETVVNRFGTFGYSYINNV